MPLPGGAADKFGNRFEGHWTVVALVDLLLGESQSIWLEPWYEAGEGIEFTVTARHGRQAHSVKSQSAVTWTLNKLASEGVLGRAKSFLGEAQTNRFVFVAAAQTAITRLIERANLAESDIEFRALLASQPDRRAFEQLRRAWRPWDDDEIWHSLRRFDVRFQDAVSLCETANDRIRLVIRGDVTAARLELAEFALEHTSHRVTTGDAWQAMLARGLEPTEHWRSETLVGKLADLAESYVREQRRLLPGERHVPRAARDEILTALFDESTARRAVVTGDAGTGKSVVLSDIVAKAGEEGIAVLPLRVDRLVVAGTPLSSRALGEHLGLPDSPPRVLSGVAQDRDGLLLIDQVDAVSAASGRSLEFLNVVEDLLAEAEAAPRLRVVVACRAYDLANDNRLGRIAESSPLRVHIGRFTESELAGVLTELGYDAGRLTPEQVELLRLPFNLRLFVAAVSPSGPHEFSTVTDLLEVYWDVKRRACDDRLGRPSEWNTVIRRLADELSGRRALAAPSYLFGEFTEDVNALASEGVLSRDGQQLSFSHEMFFDFAYARAFVADRRDVIEFLRSDEQHLFRRGQVRQILTYQHYGDPEAAARTIETVLLGGDVRFHIKQALFDALRAFPTVSRGEANTVRRVFAASSSSLDREIRALLASAPAWFDAAADAGWLDEWLSHDADSQIDEAVAILSAMQKQRPERVIQLMDAHRDGSEAWRRRVQYVVEMADLTKSVEFFGWALALVRDGELDDMSSPGVVNPSPWDFCYQLARARPAWAAQLARAMLDRWLERRGAEGRGTHDISDQRIDLSELPDPNDHEFFTTIARQAPESFLDQFLPWMIDVMRRTASASEDSWAYDAFGGGNVGRAWDVRGGLVAGAELALRTIAERWPPGLRKWLDQLRQSLFFTARYLAARGFTFGGEALAEEAATYILEDPTRLAAGFGSNAHWAGRELLAAIVPHCAPETRTRLFAVVREYQPRWELERNEAKWRGYTRLTLLGGITDNHLDAATRRHVQELRRKFVGREPEPPKEPEFSWVGPPIPREAATKLTDDDWLAAMRTYASDSVAWDRPLHMAGGVHQLAQVLQEETAASPDRFAALAMTLPDDVNAEYFSAILRGLSDAADRALPNAVFAACRRIHMLPGRPCGQWITNPIAKFAAIELPSDILAMVGWYATEDPDPAADRPLVISGEGMDAVESLINEGLNSVRGAAATTVASLLAADPQRLGVLLETVERLVVDPSTPVRVLAAEVLLAIYASHGDAARRLFAQLISQDNDALLATRSVERFISVLGRRHPAEARPIVERMLASTVPSVGTAAGRQAAFAALIDSSGAALAAKAMTGSEAQRLGAAAVYAANLRDEEVRDACAAGLMTLFDDESSPVRREAATCFEGMSGELLNDLRSLIDPFLETEAFADDPGPLIRAIADAPDTSPDLVLAICRQYVSVAGPQAGDFRTRWAAEGKTVSGVIVRTYVHAPDDDKSEILDIIDSLAEVRAYGLDEAVTAFERTRT